PVLPNALGTVCPNELPVTPDMQAKHPGRALEKAVKGMLPKGPLGYAMIKKLKVYGGAEHPHTAQQPKALEI
ncbi:uL13 family ribosomal protein, partial [Acidovorax sp. NPDC077664]|uniref:uL13 family ribosomal protein n=1 Tax=Acidovorax sp. NPDC077664 TaxID=3390544 RepID=UPI003D006521